MKKYIYVVYRRFYTDCFDDGETICYFNSKEDAERYCNTINSQYGAELYYEPLQIGNFDMTSTMYGKYFARICDDGTLKDITQERSGIFTKFDDYIGYDFYGNMCFVTYIPSKDYGYKDGACLLDDPYFESLEMQITKAVEDAWEKFKIEHPNGGDM